MRKLFYLNKSLYVSITEKDENKVYLFNDNGIIIDKSHFKGNKKTSKLPNALLKHLLGGRIFEKDNAAFISNARANGYILNESLGNIPKPSKAFDNENKDIEILWKFNLHEYTIF